MTTSVGNTAPAPRIDEQRRPVVIANAISMRFQRGNTHAIESISLEASSGEFLSIVGPSGCGKTTLLKILSGLMRPTDGSVSLKGHEVRSPPAEMLLVFQDYARSLFPWLTVRSNVMFPLKRVSAIPRSQKERRVFDAIEAVGLAGFLDHYPWELSGGMQQRLALARALAFQAEILLLDEPFASVDALTRAELEDLVLHISGQFGLTCLLVTHDIDEAVYLSDRVLVLSPAPTRIVDEIRVDLPRPRVQTETRKRAAFADLRTQIFDEITGFASPTQTGKRRGQGTKP